MALAPGSRVGAYEVLGSLGAGGMGEVYRARDTRLGRDAALKILPEAFADDPDRLMRFEREARTLASLNHPHIAAIYGLEETGGARALAMELVEGEDLSVRIARGPIPLDEALPIARQIAEALEAAHDTGIIHRDLKPANIKVRADGTVKVLDFGLAKAMEPGVGSREPGVGRTLVDSPTITSPAMPFDYRSGHPEQGRGVTMHGVILGTAAYMAPEQAKGKPVDKRADIWAFGCVLYEMLAGRRAFGPSTGSGSPRASSRGDGEDFTDTITAVLRDPPDWSALPAGTPVHVVRVLRRCLDKDVRQRLRDIGDARLELARDGEESDVARVGPVPAPRSRLTSLVATGAAALVLGALAATAFLPRSSAPSPSSRPLRLVVDAPPGVDRLLTPQISSDGRSVAFSAFLAGASLPQLWLRALDTPAAEVVAGSAPQGAAAWSPDSRVLVYPEYDTLVRLDVATGTKRTIARLGATTLAAISRYSATWGAGGEIIFCMGGTLFRVSAEGGAHAPLRVAGTPAGEEQRMPAFLPDGRRFVFLSSPPGAIAGSLYVASIDGGPSTRLFEAESQGVYSMGHLLFVRDGNLTAQPFDAVTARPTGDPFVLASDVPVVSRLNLLGAGLGQFAASSDGVIVYMAQASQLEPLRWVNRSGTEVGTVGPADAYFSPRISPDGRRVVVGRLDPLRRQSDIWVLDIEGTGATRLTFDPGFDFLPVWMPDGKAVLWGAQRGSRYQILRKQADGSGAEEVVRESANSIVPDDVSPDGRVLVFREADPETRNDLWLLPLDGSGDARPLARTPEDEPRAQFSPDGRLIAYLADEAFAQPFPALDSKWQLAPRGSLPRWRRDGRELFYVSQDTLFARSVLSTVPLRLGEPVALFTPPRVPRGSFFQVSPDGQRFLFAVDPVDPASLKYHVAMGWWAGR